MLVSLKFYVDDVSGQDGLLSQVQPRQQSESEQPSNSLDSQANSRNQPNVLQLLDGLQNNSNYEALSKSAAADCSSDHLRDDSDVTQSILEHEEDANCDGIIDTTRKTGGTQTADTAQSEDAQRSAGKPEDSGQTGGDRAEEAGSHGVEERRKAEPLVPQALMPTQTAAAATEMGDLQQVVDLRDAGDGGETLTSTVGGDTEQTTGSPDVGSDTQQREKAASSTTMESVVGHQVSPDVGDEEQQLPEASAAPHHDPDNCEAAGGGPAQSEAGDATEFSTSAEEDKAAAGACWFLLSPEMIHIFFLLLFYTLLFLLLLVLLLHLFLPLLILLSSSSSSSGEEEENDLGNEAQSSQSRPGLLIPDTKGKTSLDGEKKLVSTGSETNSLVFDWHNVQRNLPSPRRSHGLNLHKVVQVQLRTSATFSEMQTQFSAS